jgi:DNA polymerase-3 subunit epsilon
MRYAVLDTRTTGFYPSRDRIVEVAVEVVDARGERLDEYATLVNPGHEFALGGRIEPHLLRNAPVFEVVAGDVLRRLAGSVWVGHNVGFDLGFLRAEYARLDYQLPEAPAVCTMRLSHHFGPKVECYRLRWLCEAFDIECGGEQTSQRCAAATSQLFVRLLALANERGSARLEDLEDLGADSVSLPFVDPDRLPFAPSEQRLTSEAARSCVPDRSPTYVDRLVSNLKPAAGLQAGDDKLGFYLHLLDRVLQDRRIDVEEQDQLVLLAKEWRFALEDVRRAHEIYVGMLVATALDDGVITNGELGDLEGVCELLGVSRATLRSLVERAERTTASR